MSGVTNITVIREDVQDMSSVLFLLFQAGYDTLFCKIKVIT